MTNKRTHADGGIPSTEKGDLYSLKWSRHQSFVTTGLLELLEDEEFSMTDVTLACEGEFIQAHKVALAWSSPFFKRFFKMNRVDKAGTTLIALANIKFEDLKNIVQFIYRGEVHVRTADLSSFLAAAKLLQIQGLNQCLNQDADTLQQSNRLSKLESSVPVSTAPSSAKDSTSGTRSRPVSSDSNPTPSKRTRMSSATSISTNTTTQLKVPSVAIATPPRPNVETYSSMNSMHYQEIDEEEEEMISFEDVKPQPISVYSIDDKDEVDYAEGGADDSAGDRAMGDEMEIINFAEVQYNSTSEVSNPSLVLNEALGSGSSAGAQCVVQSFSKDSSVTGRPSVGRCKFCPTYPKTSSRTRCYSCKEYLCAKQSCRVNIMLPKSKSVVNVCLTLKSSKRKLRGRCHCCPNRISSRTSRTKCHYCQDFVCAGPLCRVRMGSEIICRKCSDFSVVNEIL